ASDQSHCTRSQNGLGHQSCAHSAIKPVALAQATTRAQFHFPGVAKAAGLDDAKRFQLDLRLAFVIPVFVDGAVRCDTRTEGDSIDVMIRGYRSDSPHEIEGRLTQPTLRVFGKAGPKIRHLIDTGRPVS